MGANVTVSSDDLRTLSTKFDNLSTELSSLLEDIKGNVEEMSTVWLGTASESFATNIGETYSTFDSAIAYLAEVSTGLSKAADNYDSAEDANTATATT